MSPEQRERLRTASKSLGMAAADLRVAASALERTGVTKTIGKLRAAADGHDAESRRLWLRAGQS